MPANISSSTIRPLSYSEINQYYLGMTSFKGPPSPSSMFLILLFFLQISSSRGTTESWHHEVPFFLPPDPDRPCRHGFRDDAESSALLADFVVIGQPTPTYRHSPGVLYNASVLVEQVLKRPSLSIYPVREGYPILTGPFSQWIDLGRCWINVHPARKYIFFIERPNWAGFFRISHLPLAYTTHRWQKIRSILKHPPSPLQMRALHHQENISVKQGDEVALSCVVSGRPAPLISWYVNNTQQLGLWNIATGRGVVHKNKRRSRLHISNMQPTDSGNYSCLAENVNGYIKKTVVIYVVPQPHTTPVPWTTTAPVTDAGADMLVDDVSCISQYYGTRCEYAENVPNETNFIQSECKTGCDQFFGRLVLFSTLGALLSLLLLILLCLFVKRKSRSNYPRNSLRASETLAHSSIPMGRFGAVSDQSPESVSRVCGPLGQPNSYIQSSRAVSGREPSHSVINTFLTVSSSAEIGIDVSNPILSILPFSPDSLDTNGHLPHS